jgi:sucrose-6-phosphate hydrolase SacC (GH32 family)
VVIDKREIRNTMSLDEFHPTRNTYEIQATFHATIPGRDFGMNLCVGGSEKVVLGYHASTANVYLDRRASGDVSFSPSFPRVSTAPIAPGTGTITFHVFVDLSSIEVFVNDGEVVLSSLIFPDPANTGVELFSVDGKTTLRSLTAWELNSIWN